MLRPPTLAVPQPGPGAGRRQPGLMAGNCVSRHEVPKARSGLWVSGEETPDLC